MAAPKSEMQQDMDRWVARANNAAKDHTAITNPMGQASWSSSFFGCFDPIDTCFVTCCCPCVTFGKTHHRLHKSSDLAGYSPVNASCLGWWAVSCVGLHCLPNLLQRSEIRERSQPPLQGNFVTDFLKAWCCSCCDLVQQDKEAIHLLALEKGITMEQPGKTAGMTYGPQ